MMPLKLLISGPKNHITTKFGIRYSLVVYLKILRSLVQKNRNQSSRFWWNGSFKIIIDLFEGMFFNWDSKMSRNLWRIYHYYLLLYRCQQRLGVLLEIERYRGHQESFAAYGRALCRRARKVKIKKALLEVIWAVVSQ